jgi:ABC-type branched-subunit amino acid transport system substrate-binding protein
VEKVDSVATLAERSLTILERLLLNNPELLTVEPVQLKFRKLQQGECAKVVLMLPLGTEAEPATRYVDFYRGFLMGLDSLRLSGRSVDLHLYNTARDSVRIADIVASGELETADLVMGPVYEEELKPVLAALEGKGIPVVSPLSTHTDIKSNILFQMAPAYASRFDKVHELFDGSRKVFLISTPHVDTKFDAAVRELLKKDSLTVVEKSYFTAPGQTIGKDYSGLLAELREGPAVVIVTSNNEYEVEKILTSLNTMRQNIANRTGNSEPFVVIGNGSWSRFQGIENVVFYRNRIRIMSSYNSDRYNKINAAFERRFIRTYTTMPSLYAFRGYDAAMLFVKALYGDHIESNLENVHFQPLATPYLFKKNETTGVRSNSEWIKLIYNRDNTITHE